MSTAAIELSSFFFPTLPYLVQASRRTRHTHESNCAPESSFFYKTQGKTTPHLVGDNTDLHVGLRIQNSLVREGLVSDLVEGIARVRDELAQENLMIAKREREEAEREDTSGNAKMTGQWYLSRKKKVSDLNTQTAELHGGAPLGPRRPPCSRLRAGEGVGAIFGWW